MRFIMMGDTRRNTHYADKPNEDYYCFNQSRGFALVLDGVTRSRQGACYPNPSPSRIVSEAFADAAGNVLTAPDEMRAEARLALAARQGNAAVAQKNQDFPSAFLPGTVGVLTLFDDAGLHYAYIGDSNGILISAGKLMPFTYPQTEAVHRRRSEFTTDEIRTYICNNAEHPCGYGVWNGQPGALCFLRIGTLPLSAGDRVLLCTDGLNPFLDSISESKLANLDSTSLLQRAMAFEAAGWMDDRTAIIVEAQE